MSQAVSVIICTRNRAESLKETINSVLNAEIPSGWGVQLIVVDNGSTDATSRIVESISSTKLKIDYLHEPTPGKCNALNTAICRATGNLFLFTDDDVRVAAHWIRDMSSPILRGEYDAVQGGVRIAPHLERSWLRGMFRIWFAAVENPAVPPEGLVGANMALSRNAIERVGGFDPELGPGASGFYDDTLLGWQLERVGGKIAYCPDVQVVHHFDESRLTCRAMLAIARKMAFSRALIERKLELHPSNQSLGALSWQIPGFAYRSLTQVKKYLTGRIPDESFFSRYYHLLLWIFRRRQT